MTGVTPGTGGTGVTPGTGGTSETCQAGLLTADPGPVGRQRADEGQREGHQNPCLFYTSRCV